MGQSRPDIPTKESIGWSWPRLVDKQSNKSPRPSSSMLARRRSSAVSEMTPDPRLIPLPISPEMDESARGRSETSADSETLTEDGQAMSEAVSQSIGALSGIDKWKRAASVSILITFWEKLDDKKKQSLVSNDAADIEAGPDSPDQSTASHPRSTLSIDSLAQRKDSIAFQVRYEESEEDGEDDISRSIEADVQSDSNKGQSQPDTPTTEPGARQRRDFKSYDTTTSVPDTIESWLTAPERRADSSDQDTDGFSSEKCTATTTAPSFSPHENMRMALGSHRSPSMVVEDESVQEHDDFNASTSDVPDADSMPPPVEAARDNSVQGHYKGEESASGDLLVERAGDQGGQQNDEAKDSSDDDPATIALPSSNASTAVFAGSDGQPVGQKPIASQDSTIRQATRHSDWAFDSPTSEEKVGAVQQPDSDDHPTAEQPETPRNESYFAPRAPSFYVKEPPSTEDHLLFSTPAEKAEVHQKSDKDATQRFSSGNVYGSSGAGPLNTVDTPKLDKGQVLGNDDTDGTPELVGDSLAGKALALSTQATVEAPEPTSPEATEPEVSSVPDPELPSTQESELTPPPNPALPEVPSPPNVPVSDEEVTDIAPKGPEEPLPVPSIRIQAATSEQTSTPKQSFDTGREELDVVSKGFVERKPSISRAGPLPDDALDPGKGLTTKKSVTLTTSTAQTTCTLDGQKKRKRRLFFGKVRNITMRKHVLNILIGRGLAGQARPVLRKLAKGECTVVGDLEVHAHG